MGGKVSIEDLPALKNALLHPDPKTRTQGLAGLLKLSEAHENLNAIMLQRVDLLPRLSDVFVCDRGPDHLAALKILSNLSSAAEFGTSMACSNQDTVRIMLTSLKAVIEGRVVEDRVHAVRVLLALAGTKGNNMLIASAPGMVPMLVKLVTDGDTVTRSCALKILHRVAAVPESAKDLANADVGLLPALKTVLIGRSGIDRLEALGLLKCLSSTSSNRVLEDGLLPLLITALVEGSKESRLATLNVFVCLSNTNDIKAALINDERFLPALLEIVGNGTNENKAKALEVLTNLSQGCSGEIVRKFSSLGILSTMVKMAVDSIDLRHSALSVLRNVFKSSDEEAVMTLTDVPSLLHVLVEVLKVESDKMQVLDILCGLSCSTDNLLHMRSDKVGLIPHLVKVAAGGKKTRSAALRLLNMLSTAEASSLLVQSFKVLKKILEECHGEDKLVLLNVFHILSQVPSNRILLAPRKGFLALMIKLVSDSYDKCSFTALCILRELSSAAETIESMTADKLGIFSLLKRLIDRGDLDFKTSALEILINLSAHENKLPMVSTLGLVAVLVNVVLGKNVKCTISALTVLRNIATTTDPIVLTSVASSGGVLPALKTIIARTHGRKALSLACAILLSLSLSPLNMTSMTSQQVGLLPALATVVGNIVSTPSSTVDSSVGEPLSNALEILCNLSSVAKVQKVLADDFALVPPAMIKVVTSTTVDIHLKQVALRIVSHLSEFPELSSGLVVSDLGLLSVLKQELRAPSSTEIVSLSVHILYCLSFFPLCRSHCTMGSASLGLIPILFGIARVDRGVVKAKALITLGRLVEQVSVVEDGFVSALESSSNCWVSDVDPSLKQQAITSAEEILRHLNVTVMTTKVLKTYGVSPELFLTCTQFCEGALARKLTAHQENGAPADDLAEIVILDKFLMSKRTDIAEVVALDITASSEFCRLNTNICGQAHWLRGQLEAHFTMLNMNNSGTMSCQQRAYLPFYTIMCKYLPGKQVIPTIPSVIPIADVRAYAEITEAAVNLQTTGSTVVNGIYHRGGIRSVVMIKLRREEFIDVANHELNLLEILYRHAPLAVVASFGMVRQSNSTLRKGNNCVIRGDDLAHYVGIVLEKGNFTMADNLSSPAGQDPIQQRFMLAGAIKIVEAAHRQGIVLMDFKPDNIVFCSNTNSVGHWKAIDFDNSLQIDARITKTATPHYASKEVAQHILSSNTELLAHPAMDISSLGWMTWKIFSSGVSHLSSVGINRDDHTRILEWHANLTQPVLEGHVNRCFPYNAALRSFLCKVLHENPNERPSAAQMSRTTSLVCERDPTVSFDVANAVNEAINRVYPLRVRDSNMADVVTSLAEIVGLLKERPNLSLADITGVMQSHTTAMTDQLLPHITTIMEDTHEAMTELMKLDTVVQMVSDVQVQLAEVVSMQRTQLSMLTYMQAYHFPHTFILIPKRPTVQPTTIRGKIGAALNAALKALADQLFTTMYLFFFCPVTGKLVPCGPGGQGYVLSTLKEWVKQLIPVVKMGLFAAKVVLATQGLGGLIPNFPSKDDQDQLSEMLADLSDGVDMGSEALQEQATTESVEDCIVSSLKDQLMDGIVTAVAKQDGVQSVPDTKAYRPKKSGLELAEFTHPNGTVTRAWVSEDGRARFALEGSAAFK